MITIPSKIPGNVTAGDTWQWYASFSDFSPVDGWNLTYTFRKIVETSGKHRTDEGLGPTTVTTESKTASGVQSGTQWLVTIAAASSGWTPGKWSYIAKVSGVAGQVYTVDSGELFVAPDLSSQASNYDPRTRNEYNLDKVQEAIRVRLEGGVVDEYHIGDRSIRRATLSELRVMESQLRRAVRAEKGKSNVKLVSFDFVN